MKATMTYDNQRAWPRTRRSGTARSDPRACFQAPGILEISDRSVAGPLRLGTEPRVGPRGIRGGGIGGSDMGMDRMELPPVDRIGVKYPEVDRPVRPISRLVRSYNKGKRDY
jgi:hypothetical protein